jgi:SAM-dependent methyltransferase
MGSFASTRSTSLKEQAYAFRHIHGRRYHADQGPGGSEYNLPNDELELDRLDLQHHLFLLTLKDHPLPLHCAPLPQDIQSVLDIGTGTGIWAIDMADEYPSASVVGTDLSPVQPNYVPPNCRFYVEDAEKPWSFSTGGDAPSSGEGPFDYIHGRMLVVGIRNWARFFEQCYANLKPGGWVEMQDLNFPARVDDDSAPQDSPLMEWSGLMMRGAARLGINLEASNEFARLLAEAGFQEIRSETHAWPINRWPRDKVMKERGMWVMQNFLQGLHGFSMAYFTRGLGWKPQEVEVIVAKVREQSMDKRSHVYMPISFFWARRPE